MEPEPTYINLEPEFEPESEPEPESELMLTQLESEPELEPKPGIEPELLESEPEPEPDTDDLLHYWNFELEHKQILDKNVSQNKYNTIKKINFYVGEYDDLRDHKININIWRNNGGVRQYNIFQKSRNNFCEYFYRKWFWRWNLETVARKKY